MPKQQAVRKVGARHTRSEYQQIQDMHDLAVKLGASCHCGPQMVKSSVAAITGDAFMKGAVVKVDAKLGLVFGWGIVCKVDGEPYFDSQGDYIPEESMLKAAAEFMEFSRVSGEMHARDAAGNPIPDGGVVFSFPLTADIGKALGIACDRTGWMVAVKPSPDVLAKYESGEYTGFSIGGARVTDEEVAKA